MCIPIALDVPVVTVDRVELGTAREILCTSAHKEDSVLATGPSSIDELAHVADLWLRVEGAAESNLFIPFADILETRPDGVRVAVLADEVAERGWDRVPPGLALGRACVA